ncbi:hypothetical protein [Streptomyces fractus]|uniref:hypothetical protein n=1 Tax=Streptomyces fractus TaxID=641806 RepID=UPI003CFA2FBD
MNSMKNHGFSVLGYARGDQPGCPPGAFDTLSPRGGGKESLPLAFVVQQADQVGAGKGALEAPPEDLAAALRALPEIRKKRSGAFAIVSASPQQETLCTVRPVTGDSAHDVFSPDGTPLARINRAPGTLLPWPRRTRWTIQLTQENASFTGRKGTWYSWLLFALLSPLWLVVFALALVFSLLGDDATWLDWEPPSRTKWRRGEQWGLDYRGVSSTYIHSGNHLHPGIAYAQATLHAWSR